MPKNSRVTVVTNEALHSEPKPDATVLNDYLRWLDQNLLKQQETSVAL